jgi:hypothetical protein
MGSFRFQALPELLRDSPLERVYLSGIEGLPWRTTSAETEGGFVATRENDETAVLHFPWRSPRVGDVMLCSSSLMHRERAYDLALELARGTVNRVRTFAAELRVAGFVLSSEAETLVGEATAAFIEVLVSDKDRTAQTRRAIESALEAGEAVSSEYAKQAITHRKRQSPKLPTMLAAQIATTPVEAEEAALKAGFNTVSLPFHWGKREPNPGQYDWTEIDERVAWCHEQGIRICAGPLISLQKSAIPEWTYLWEDDFDQLLECAVKYIQTAVRRYQGKVHVWHSAARINEGGALELTEDQRLRLYLASVEAIRQIDKETPVVASLDQPWGEYLREQNISLSPFHYADALVRSELGIAGIGLELNYGFASHATFPRDWIDFSRQLDRWSMLGAPLMIEITAPTSKAPDARAKMDSVPLTMVPAMQDAQQWFVQHALPILLAKPYIHGVICNQVLERAEYDFPNATLIQADGSASQSLRWLTQLREECLM